MHIPMYVMIKCPRSSTVAPDLVFALTIILGLKLDIQKQGSAVSEGEALAVQTIYIVGAIRLAAIAGGLLLASIWTVLSYPISEHAQLCKTLAECLVSLARYHSVTYDTVRILPRRGDNDTFSELSLIQRSEKASSKLFAKCKGQLTSLHPQLKFTKSVYETEMQSD